MALAYLKGCEICNEGLCVRGKELLAEGMSLREVSRTISIEIKDSRGGIYLFSPSAIRNRIQEHTGLKKRGGSRGAGASPLKNPKPEPELGAEEKAFDAETERLKKEFAEEEAEFDEFCESFKGRGNPFPDALKPMLIELIKYGYRSLAIKYHPDKPGGSADAMAKLNNVRDILLIMAN